MKMKYLPILAVGLLLFSCGDTENSVSDLKFASLSGEFQIAEGCTVKSQGARASVTNCYLEDFVRWPIEITGDATLGEEKITFQGRGDEYWEDEGCFRSTCDIKATGTFEKLSSRQVSGPFEAFAGEWEGRVVIDHVCSTIEVTNPSNPRCYRDADNVGDRYVSGTKEWQEYFPVQASIYGSRIETTGRTNVEVLIDDDTLTVNNTRFDRH